MRPTQRPTPPLLPLAEKLAGYDVEQLTPSIGLRHPAANYCLHWLRHRPRPTSAITGYVIGLLQLLPLMVTL